MKQFSLLLCLLAHVCTAQVTMQYYLPTDVTYNSSIPTPEQVLGYVPGEWHVSHDQLLTYMYAVAGASDRIAIEKYAKSHEGRQLLQLIITSPTNHKNLAAIKASRKHVKTGQGGDTPLVVQIGYSVHGNEPSGSNAALLTAYYLAAAQGAKIDKMLAQTVIIFDPSFNPDGLNRFASWVNSHKSKNVNSDPSDREYNEPWPGGRTNHYWFDLNRDWLPIVHPESQGRIRQFHDWMPNILTDHHEMGTSSTFFFQPGVPSRKFPNTDDRNAELTSKIGTFHAAVLDSIGSLYYTKEGFDDFFIGKGSTYPDVNGSVGILFEQASSRGHAQEGPYGILTFPFTIRNQFVTSLSTLAASQAMISELKAYQLQQYKDAAKWNTPKAYVFGDKDLMKTAEMVRMLQTHDITVHGLAKQVAVGGRTFLPGEAFVVQTNQPQARLIKSIFETRTSFTDSLFYDISAWTMPLAMNIPSAELDAKALEGLTVGEKVADITVSGKMVGGASDYAYIFETHGYYAHRAIQRLSNAGVLLRVMHEPHSNGAKKFPRGSILIPIGVQQDKAPLIKQIVEEITQNDGIDVYAISTGLAASGIDLGSPSMSQLQPLQIAILVDGGVNSSEAGEAWHVLDQRVDVKVTLLPLDRLNRTDLARYNRIVMPAGSYGEITKTGIDKLKAWVQGGGVIVAWKSAGSWLATNELSKVTYETEAAESGGYKTYADYSAATGAKTTAGSIFQAKLDVTHPLGYGFTSEYLPVFRNHNQHMKKGTNQFAHPLLYTATPLISGYVHKSNLSKIANAPAAQITALGSGRVIVLADNPNFRGFWFGTNKLFFNALYFGHTISAGTAR